MVGDVVDVVHVSSRGCIWRSGLRSASVLERAGWRVSAKATAASGQPMGTPRFVVYIRVAESSSRQ